MITNLGTLSPNVNTVTSRKETLQAEEKKAIQTDFMAVKSEKELENTQWEVKVRARMCF